MKLQTGELLVSRNGKQYRVVECYEDSVSLMPVNGYTLFSCRRLFVESSFRLATAGVA
ncbi:MAG: hypothetical protein KME12_05110 [Trichocoleus desertorum ATA4-8-CV12]|jgi:hypothetical protein|nr:hypothetical protein [Trichocoleus desertorum ATA4-8-CV12]